MQPLLCTKQLMYLNKYFHTHNTMPSFQANKYEYYIRYKTKQHQKQKKMI